MAMKRKVRGAVRLSESRAVQAGCGKRGGKWPRSTAPTGGIVAIGCGGGFPLSDRGMAVPAKACRREGRAKQGGNTEAFCSRPWMTLIRGGGLFLSQG